MSAAELTRNRVLHIALPIVLSNLTVPILGLVDTGVVGQLGAPEPIGAVGIGAVILASVYWIFGFLRMGTSGLVAQAHGAGDTPEVGAHLLRALVIGFAAGLAFVALQIPIFWAAFRLAPASPEVETLARQYLAIRIWGAPATIGLYALTGWLIAVERTRAVLALQLLQNGLNVVLDLWFVLGLALGVAGVAWATLAAEYAGLAVGLWLAMPVLRRAVAAARSGAVLLARAKMERFARVNGDIMIRSVLLQGCMTSFLFLGAGQGDVTLAANQVLLQFLTLTAFALDGFAFAAESLVGQAVGAGRPDRVRRASVLTSKWGMGGAVVLGLFFMGAGGAIIDLLTTAPGVRAEARHYLPWIGIAPLLGAGAWMLDGIFIGATLTREMRVAMIQSVAVFVLGVVLLPPVMGNHGLWAALMALNAARAVTMIRLYPRAEAAAAPA
ncbi:MATE family efflux transporter [Paracoccus sp. 1_MG-2023]|uniref:MATE family efflux transporter n=1 Tax=unclassified Paracoccus (in: a-proteobacteria) TaxID=2688777 RepID=UPI001C08F9C9|nr:MULTISPECIES: MATE family efflux transporter [unclassified Paracoccus (in: a-proteobacteria)]MBU2958108.1 MATE family efflux transporter [Paracoccus sp. C2R09]MDO6669306.1 MATE family efflux transporter [Paracoccus sp. 1_MG-2023]